MTAQLKPRIWEDGDRIYMVAPVAPLELGDKELSELAFAEEMRQSAPNKNLLWLRGQYVEADRPNLNNQMWTEGELAIKSVTPTFMPVTVMHDPRTAVGLIADTSLLTPAEHAVQRARIDTTLAVWAHRFPEVAEECQFNYEAGTLMQSMEAISPYYSCGECGKVFQKLPDHAEKANWCSHLKGDGSSKLLGAEGSAVARILGNVTFTGTGLIFGSRGAKGAYSEAHLEINQEEVAAFHQEAHERIAARESSTRPKSRSKRKMEIEDRRYEELLAAEQKAKLVPDLEAKVSTLESEKSDAERKVEETETAKVAAETERDDLKKKVDEAAEESAKSELASTRLSALGKGFKDKLGEFTTTRLSEQAKTYSDEEWESRLKELEEMSSVKRDEGGTEDADADKGNGGGGSGEFSREEVAQAGLATRTGGDGQEASSEERRSVVGSLVHPKAAAAK